MRFSPSTIIPSDFNYLDSYDCGGSEPGDIPFNITRCGDLVDENPVENFTYLGVCCVCGTHHRYGEVWTHQPTDLRLCIGHVCAAKYGLFANDAEYKNLRMAHIRKIERLKERRRIRAEIKSFLADHASLGSYLRADHRIVRDLRAKLIKWGSISDKQIALAKKIAVEMEQRAADEAEKNYVPVPETDKRIEITARVLGIKWVADHFSYDGGEVAKMIIEVEDGDGVYKLYGSVGSKLSDLICDLRDETADEWEGLTDIVKRLHPRIKFVARVERSNDDENFGFFKRPTKQEVIS